MADQVAEGFGLYHRLLQVRIMQFQLAFEALDFLKGAGVGNGRADMIREDPSLGPELLLKRLARGSCYRAQNLPFEADRRNGIPTDALLAHPVGIKRRRGPFV